MLRESDLDPAPREGKDFTGDFDRSDLLSRLFDPWSFRLPGSADGGCWVLFCVAVEPYTDSNSSQPPVSVASVSYCFLGLRDLH